MLGGGALHNKLLDLSEKLNLSGKVFLLGDRSDVRDLLPAFDIFALSSITEGYSIALVEACACRLPIVSTNVGGNSEIVIDESGGFLVPPRDPQAFAQSVVKLAMNADLRLQMGAFNRRHAEAVGSIEAMADQYDNLYGESDLSGNQPGGRR